MGRDTLKGLDGLSNRILRGNFGAGVNIRSWKRLFLMRRVLFCTGIRKINIVQDGERSNTNFNKLLLLDTNFSIEYSHMAPNIVLEDIRN